ncbi:MAG: polyphosphate kinase 1, partial [Eubacterium sp.]|nr:polyphosphate kinase 1 [Eubacterium sp.]
MKNKGDVSEVKGKAEKNNGGISGVKEKSGKNKGDISEVKDKSEKKKQGISEEKDGSGKKRGSVSVVNSKSEKKKSAQPAPKNRTEKNKGSDPVRKEKEIRKKSAGSVEKRKKSATVPQVQPAPDPSADWKQIPADERYQCFINREISWLEFNKRVLQEAADHNVPLLERLKFMGIYQSNMDEFFRVRVGILMHRIKMIPDRLDPVSGWTPRTVLASILETVREQQTLQESLWKVLKEELRFHGVDIINFKKTQKVDELMCKKIFGDMRRDLFPRFISGNKSFPFLWGGENFVAASIGTDGNTYAVVPLHRLPAYSAFELNGRVKVVLTAELVRHFLPLLLKKEEVRESAILKVIRNADVLLRNQTDEREDARGNMSDMLRRRNRETPVQLQIKGRLTEQTKAFFMKSIGVTESSTFQRSLPSTFSFTSSIPAQPGFKYESRKPVRDIGLRKGEYFDYISRHDLLLSFPFQSMMPFIDMLYEAADDPEVISIKITLYRLSPSSKLAAALAYAADRGKDVLCLLELRARFDEQNNIDYSEMLEEAGCRIIYGLPDQKVHSKLCVITKVSGGNISHITQVGTGNYNEVTSEQYTDLSLITSDEACGEDAEMVFRALSDGVAPPPAKSLWIAPNSFKSNLLALLDREMEKGEEGLVRLKINSMNDIEVMEKLIACSQAGVKIELYIRGICCLRPGIPGKTDQITIKSVVGRWLEHSRVLLFGRGEDERIFIGSGDLLNRNTDRRVEAFIEVVTEETKDQIRRIMDAFADDREKARVMKADGTYYREEIIPGTSSQNVLYDYFSEIRIDKDAPARTRRDVFSESGSAEEQKPAPSPEVLSAPEQPASENLPGADENGGTESGSAAGTESGAEGSVEAAENVGAEEGTAAGTENGAGESTEAEADGAAGTKNPDGKPEETEKVNPADRKNADKVIPTVSETGARKNVESTRLTGLLKNPDRDGENSRKDGKAKKKSGSVINRLLNR